MFTNNNSIDPLILAYIYKLQERGLGHWVDRIFPSREIFREIEAMAGKSALEVVKTLALRIVENIHLDTAAEVVGASGEAAVEILAKKIALWYVQLARELGVIK